MLQSIMCDSYLCIHECIYCAQGWPAAKRQKSWLSNHGIILPKNNGTTASKKYNVFIQLIIFHLKENYANPRIPPVGKYGSILYTRYIYTTSSFRWNVSLCMYLRLGLLLPHQHHQLPLEISRGFHACRFRWTLTGALRKGSQTSWWMARPLLSEEIQLSGGCQNTKEPTRKWPKAGVTVVPPK